MPTNYGGRPPPCTTTIHVIQLAVPVSQMRAGCSLIAEAEKPVSSSTGLGFQGKSCIYTHRREQTEDNKCSSSSNYYSHKNSIIICICSNHNVLIKKKTTDQHNPNKSSHRAVWISKQPLYLVQVSIYCVQFELTSPLGSLDTEPRPLAVISSPVARFRMTSVGMPTAMKTLMYNGSPMLLQNSIATNICMQTSKAPSSYSHQQVYNLTREFQERRSEAVPTEHALPEYCTCSNTYTAVSGVLYIHCTQGKRTCL